MAIFTRVTGKMMQEMVKENSYGKMEISILANGKITRNQVKDYILAKMEINIMECGVMIK